MTKKKLKKSSDIEQSKRFKEAARKLIDAGDLSPTEADARMDSFVANLAHNRRAT